MHQCPYPIVNAEIASIQLHKQGPDPCVQMSKKQNKYNLQRFFRLGQHLLRPTL